MAEPFKNFISQLTVQHAARHLARVWPQFDRARFERIAGTGLEKLELKVRANGDHSRKVFKGWNLTLAGGEKRVLAKRHSLRPVTTRRLYPGKHRIDVLVNGKIVAGREFELLPA